MYLLQNWQLGSYYYTRLGNVCFLSYLCLQLPGIFDGCHFYLPGNFEYPTPTKEELASLVKLGGGSVLSREPKSDLIFDQSQLTMPYHARPDSQLARCSYFIVHDNKHTSQMLNSHICTVPASFVMDCIAHFELLDLPS